MKQFYLGIFLIALFQTTFAQQKDKTILIVPFDTKLYNNEESDKMVKQSKMTYEQTVAHIKSSLDASITSAIKDSCKVYSLLRTYTTDAQTDLDIVHEQANYYLVNRPENLEEKQQLSAIEKTKKKIKKTKAKTKKTTAPPKGEVVSVKTDNSDKFLSVKFPDPQLFIDLVLNYKANNILFITQFEIIGDYSNPYLVGQGKYPRNIRVHYVIYNSKGKFVKGDYEEVTYTSDENDINLVCTKYLPLIAKKIAKQIP